MVENEQLDRATRPMVRCPADGWASLLTAQCIPLALHAAPHQCILTIGALQPVILALLYRLRRSRSLAPALGQIAIKVHLVHPWFGPGIGLGTGSQRADHGQTEAEAQSDFTATFRYLI